MHRISYKRASSVSHACLAGDHGREGGRCVIDLSWHLLVTLIREYREKEQAGSEVCEGAGGASEKLCVRNFAVQIVLTRTHVRTHR